MQKASASTATAPTPSSAKVPSPMSDRDSDSDRPEYPDYGGLGLKPDPIPVLIPRDIHQDTCVSFSRHILRERHRASVLCQPCHGPSFLQHLHQQLPHPHPGLLPPHTRVEELPLQVLPVSPISKIFMCLGFVLFQMSDFNIDVALRLDTTQAILQRCQGSKA